MGNNIDSSSTNNLQSCLLTKRELFNLRTGDKFDHRDMYGLFAAAVVVEKSGHNIYIKYEHFSDKWNTWDNFQKNPLSFAKYQSVSLQPATSSLTTKNVGQFIAFKAYPNDNSCKWKKGKIIKKDTHSGQVQILYKNNKKRWTHLDNTLEVAELNSDNFQSRNSRKKTRNKSHSRNNINCNTECNSNYSNYNASKYQMQQQSQIQRQDQMTVRTQLLLDDTHKQIKLTKNYLEAAANHSINKNELSVFNQKVIVGLTCFRMKVSGMRKNGETEGVDFTNAFKSCSMIIKQFENECIQQFGHNKYLMKRLKPCINYMRAVLKGNKNIPPLPYVNEYEFNETVASSVISQINHAQNHVLVDRMNDINKNNKQYKKNQKQLKVQYEYEIENNGADKVNNVDFNELIQDYNTNNIAFGNSKQEQDAIIKQQQYKYKFQAPDLMNMDDDC